MKCRKCGNTRRFKASITSKAWGDVYYNEETGEVESYDEDDVETDFDYHECAECGSGDVYDDTEEE